ncbi:MAG: hypothetical protein HC930_15675, partial [Hydrococcus sp. SU_1_0]|nr:hypothetical protein [Hydrococcus sp. SU_1_0]
MLLCFWWGYIFIFVGDKKFKINHRTWRFPQASTSLTQIGVFALDWGLAAAVLYCLIPSYPHQS